jgi:predicted RNase H-like HicB family nuclease
MVARSKRVGITMPGAVVEGERKGAVIVCYWVRLRIEVEQEEDGRWIAEVHELPGALVYAVSRVEAITRAKTLALRVLADRLEEGSMSPTDVADISFYSSDPTLAD